MSKGQSKRKNEKKKPLKTLDEKKQAKREKEANKDGTGKITAAVASR